MDTHHYVYRSYEEWGRDYIGVRSCNCLPEEDIKYFGSFSDKSFKPTEKTILFVCETRKEAAEIEIRLHNFFDVAVNPQFANKTKATSTGFSMAGVIAGPHTEETKKKISKANTGKIRTEAQKKAHSERMAGEKNPLYGVPRTEAQKKTQSERISGRYLGALSPRSKAIIAIEPDGTERHFGSGHEAARELEINWSSLSYHLKIGHVLKCGKFKGWQFLYESFLSENR
jgi:hypothetical protein